MRISDWSSDVCSSDLAADDYQLPSVLSDADIDRYQRIFDLQADGDWKDADRIIHQLHDKLLMGHVLHQRYMHPTAYYSSYGELAAWLREYRNLPGADRSEEHTSELQSLMRISYAVFCWKKKTT